MPTRRRPITLPDCLTIAGNQLAWETMVKHLCDGSQEPILVAGPIGSGKTFGVERVCLGMRCRLTVFDASTRLFDLERSLRAMLGTQTFDKDERGVLLEGVNGFSDDMLDVVAKHVEAMRAAVERRREARAASSRRPPPLMAPFVATCVDAWAQNLGALRDWKRVTLRRPRVEAIERAMSLAFPGRAPSELSRAAHACEGDLRQATASLQFKGGSAESFGKDVERHLFDRTRGLLKRYVHPDEWCEAAYDGDIGFVGAHPQLLHHNYPQLLAGASRGALDHVARFADALSLVAAWPHAQMHHLAWHARIAPTSSDATLRFPKVDRPTPASTAGSVEAWQVPKDLRKGTGGGGGELKLDWIAHVDRHPVVDDTTDVDG